VRRIAVILGAGASSDAWNETGPPRNQVWQPPLARELFGQREAFWPILERYPGAHVVSADLGELIRTGSVNIEAKLREYAEHTDPRIRNHFKQVPPYLRDVINQVVVSFTGRAALPGTRFEAITINGGRGRLCSVCRELIPTTAEGSFQFTYPDGRVFTFHDRCEQLWQEERHQVRR